MTPVIENVYPELDCGRFPIKREVGDVLNVWADIFAEGHGVLAAKIKWRLATESAWHESEMTLFDNDRWYGSFLLAHNTRYFYTIEAHHDAFESWKQELLKRRDAGEDLDAELLEGQRLVADATQRATGADRESLKELLRSVRSASPAEALELFASLSLAELMHRNADASNATRYGELEVVTDRPKARFTAWYEMFHRSQGSMPGQSATWADCRARLEDVKRMGFDVVYLPPIHPIGITGRKGANNLLAAGPNEPGSPWAIGNEFGGHKAINPELGTLEEFDEFVSAAEAAGLEVALDFAVQCSPNHPYARQHPDWFYRRPDGTIRYAENPPKKYQDIYPLNLLCEDRASLWEELKSIVLFWIGHGVRIFRVDNPHTKPFHFWEWLIREIQSDYPDVIFLAEAFTRPKVMRHLAKAGFTQSYTYFTWRNSKAELTEYLTELTQSEVSEYLRGNLFANTPDILPPILQTGERAAFKMRLVLAATLSSAYGIYNSFELCEGRAIPGSEEYADSEKYQYKVWDWDRPGNIKDYIGRVNRIRREHSALHEYKNLRFYQADDDQVLFYGKRSSDGTDAVLIAVNLDVHQPHQATLHLPLAELGLDAERPLEVSDLIHETDWCWKGGEQSVLLDPATEPAVIFTLRQ